MLRRIEIAALVFLVAFVVWLIRGRRRGSRPDPDAELPGTSYNARELHEFDQQPR